MTKIVRTFIWSQTIGAALDIPEFGRHRNATTDDATLPKRLSSSVFAFAAANCDLTVILRCRDCCKHPRAAFGALSSYMHCWSRQLQLESSNWSPAVHVCSHSQRQPIANGSMGSVVSHVLVTSPIFVFISRSAVVMHMCMLAGATG